MILIVMTMEYYIVNKWEKYNNIIVNNKFYLFNNLNNALEYFNKLIEDIPELNNTEIYKFSNSIEMYEYFCKNPFMGISEVSRDTYVCEINEYENDLLVYKERKTYGYPNTENIGIQLKIIKNNSEDTNLLGEFEILY